MIFLLGLFSWTGSQSDGIVNPPVRVDTASVMSFTSSSVSSSASYRVEHHQTGTKVFYLLETDDIGYEKD